MTIDNLISPEACHDLPLSDRFDRDDYPGAMRILFIGSAASTHSHSWISLLDGARANVRLFSPFEYDSMPPASFSVRTYVNIPDLSISDPFRRNLAQLSGTPRYSRGDVDAILHTVRLQNAEIGEELSRQFAAIICETFERGRHKGLADAHARELAYTRTQRLRRIAGQIRRMTFPPTVQPATNPSNPVSSISPPSLVDPQLLSPLSASIAAIRSAFKTQPLDPAVPPERLISPAGPSTEERLIEIINDWQPQIVHTLGFFEAGRWFHGLYRRHALGQRVRWVMQLRGGSDLEINRFLPAARTSIAQAAREADQIISDNTTNFSYLRKFGVDETRFALIAPVPGTGGIDLPPNLSFQVKPSERRVILWPKAYDTQYALALPVLEALKLAWERLPACRIVMLWVGQKEVVEWIETLPPQLRAACDLRGHVPREEVLSLMTTARVLLAPSLVDGRPNSALEAMASGAFPIVSPLPTLLEFTREPENVLFARNLYPQEIAEALVRAMTDDDLVDRAAVNNITLMRTIGDSAIIRQKVVHFYEDLA